MCIYRHTIPEVIPISNDGTYSSEINTLLQQMIILFNDDAQQEQTFYDHESESTDIQEGRECGLKIKQSPLNRVHKDL